MEVKQNGQISARGSWQWVLSCGNPIWQILMMPASVADKDLDSW